MIPNATLTTGKNEKETHGGSSNETVKIPKSNWIFPI